MPQSTVATLRAVDKISPTTLKLKQQKYKIKGFEIVEIDKTNHQVVQGKNRITLVIDQTRVLDNIVSRVFSSQTPTVEFNFDITNDTQFEIEVSKLDSNDTNVYEINVNFFLES